MPGICNRIVIKRYLTRYGLGGIVGLTFNKRIKMKITAMFPELEKTMEVFVNAWAVDATVETFYEMGAIWVQVREG